MQKVHMSPIRKVAGLLDEAREQKDMISFGGGAPSIAPPQAFLDEFARLLKSNPLRSCGYTGTRGIPELREAIAEDARKYGHVDFDDEEFSLALLKKKGVAVIPGRFFGKNGSGHVRLTFVSEADERIEAGIRKMAEFVSAK
jgi:aspartate aminotransferase